MIKHIEKDSLGHAEHGWLKSRHHFSFAHYYNPTRMGFGKLRVVNDDWVKAGTGFPPHPHANMEIISFIRTGAVTHKDSAGNQGVTQAGEVQVMSAGTGIVHSEYNRTDTPLTFYQIWIETNKENVAPRWESKTFPTEYSDKLSLLATGHGNKSSDSGSASTSKSDVVNDNEESTALFINQEASIYGGKLTKGTITVQNIKNQAYILASTGTFIISDGLSKVTLNKGDGAEFTNAKNIEIEAITDSEIIVIDVPQ